MLLIRFAVPFGIFNGKNGTFHKASSLRDEDVKEMVETISHRVIRLLERHGVPDGDRYDEFPEEQSLLSGIAAASVFSRVATGDRAGFGVRRVLSDPAEGVRTGTCAMRHEVLVFTPLPSSRRGTRPAWSGSACTYPGRPWPKGA